MRDLGTTEPAPGFSQIRYLLAKRTVDDRALNNHVWNSLRTALTDSRASRFRVLEIGAGIGTMIERMLDWGLFEDIFERTQSLGAQREVGVDLTAIDPDAACLAEARRRLAHCPWACATDGRLELRGPHALLNIEFNQAGYEEFACRWANGARWNLVMANAVLDLVDLQHALPVILSLLEPDGLFYFTINFDGDTVLLPVIDEEFDGLIYELYHATMDRRSNKWMAAGSRAGRLLFSCLRTLRAEIVDVGPSDWVVFSSGGRYPHDEAYFLHCLVTIIARALTGHTRLDPDRFSDWIALRHDQIDRGELTLVSHQLDFVGRASGRM
ncbi:MAG: class I SAM-dependent methyltransferase [Chloroflexi bacterium]|nr:class I SAM-dependent methyltransferase [Chloroflexota bacterium]MBV9596904.1 class I SAM-dependent methyltransferase [Chloroflexota bacterium]